tara:strand:+ start:626 stop:1231 length:606 start_codon:yes stop_codon:yes gene_type:complete
MNFKENELKDWFKSLVDYLPNLPIKSNLRNDTIRVEILGRLASQFLTDDERAKFLNLPKGCRIREGAKIVSQDKLEIGEYCNIAENAIVDASGGLYIGPHTTIGVSSYIWSHSSHLNNLKMNNQIGSDLIMRKKTSIGAGCFIGGPSVVLPGTKIGDKCLIQPFSVVSGNVPSRSLVSAKEIKKGFLTESKIEIMLKLSKN